MGLHEFSQLKPTQKRPLYTPAEAPISANAKIKTRIEEGRLTGTLTDGCIKPSVQNPVRCLRNIVTDNIARSGFHRPLDPDTISFLMGL